MSLVCRSCRFFQSFARVCCETALVADYRQWHVNGCFAGFYLAMSSLPWCAGPDARHHGRYEPEGQSRFDSDSGMCKVGFTGDSAPRAVFLSLSSGPRCAASWPVWIRRTVLLRGAALTADFVCGIWLVLLVTTCALYSLLSLACLRCVASWPVWNRRTVMSVLAGGAVVVQQQIRAWLVSKWSQKNAGSPQLQFINKVVYIPVEVPRFSHGPDCLSDQRDPQLLDLVRLQGVLVVDIPVVVQRPIPMVSLTMEIPQLLFDVVVMSLV